MDIEQAIAVYCILLLFFTGIKHYAKNFFIPAEGLIMVADLIYGMVYKYIGPSWMPGISLPPPGITLFVILPILIFARGQQVKASLLKAESLPISYYAVIGVIASAFAIGLPIAFLLDIDPIHGLLLGSAMGATDPAAVGAIFRRIGMPKRLHMLLEGESLFPVYPSSWLLAHSWYLRNCSTSPASSRCWSPPLHLSKALAKRARLKQDLKAHRLWNISGIIPVRCLVFFCFSSSG